jgi:hypothetical protein
VGKTVPAHREQYVALFGALTDEDRSHLQAFVAARSEALDRMRMDAANGGRPFRFSAWLGVFCSAATVEDALAAVKSDVAPATWEGFAGAFAHFRPKYERVWRGGEIPRAFLDAARRDPALARLRTLLTKLVRFYDVKPKKARTPRLALVPVPDGWGTHAEAIEEILFLEIPPGDTLSGEASVIVHETAHFLWSLVPQDRKRRLAAFGSGLSPDAARRVPLLHEAIPTALGQGVADRLFQPRLWSTEDDWYHTREVDEMAKKIYPMVSRALEEGWTLDERFLERILAAEAPAGSLVPR